MRKSVSVIIAAYQAQDFIEQCLDSVENQTIFTSDKNVRYEILLGVDGCKETLAKVVAIKKKYRNLRVFMMDKRKGPYITFNTLISLKQYPNFQIFGADDIMAPDMMLHVLSAKPREIVRVGFANFTNSLKRLKPKGLALGVICGNDRLLEKMGGYKPWMVSADWDLHERFKFTDLREVLIPRTMFYRRVHPNSLTQHPDTKRGSAIRRQCQAATQYEYVEPEINTYKEI